MTSFDFKQHRHLIGKRELTETFPASTGHALDKSVRLLSFNSRNNRVFCTGHHLWVDAVMA
jgi:hypothetical protein